MALPLIIATLGSGALFVVKRELNLRHKEIEKWALEHAFEQLGLPNLTGENVTRESFTQALNDGPLSHFEAFAGGGLRLTNIFDKAATRHDLEQFALSAAAQNLGINVKNLTVAGIKEGLLTYVRERVKTEIVEGGGGEFLAQAADLAVLVRIIESVRKQIKDDAGNPLPPGTKKPLKMDAKSIANRARQATYRASHSRRWIPK